MILFIIDADKLRFDWPHVTYKWEWKFMNHIEERKSARWEYRQVPSRTEI